MKYFVCLGTALFILASPLAAEEKMGTLEGTIVSREAAKNEITVQHGEVKGVMGAMTMGYQVRGQKVESLPNNGIRITAMLHESNGTYWLTDVKPSASHPMAGMQHEMTPAQHQAMPGMQHEMTPTQHQAMPGMQSMKPDMTSDFLMRQASGTSMNPAAAPMHMTMIQYGDWMLMLHGLAFVSQVVQSGPRGGDKFFSTNWGMGMADRPLGGGHLMLRSMLSLEPATVGKKYPELFQTGETINSLPIIDAQHPHDFFMELAAEYARPLTDRTIGYLYVAPMGDPSLGPVAYPHRVSASEIPQAALGHHVQDSTHIAASVITIGAQSGIFGYALSAFRGREPDEKRWNLETGRPDSWAARVTFDPTPNWTSQISTGHLKHPEAADPANIQRTTASVAYSVPVPDGQWDSSVIFGHNKKDQGRSVTSWLAESVVRFQDVNYVTGRAEVVDKDELFADQNVPAAIANATFRIKALTLGYSRDVASMRGLVGAVGANATRYSIPGAIKPYYGNPHSFYVFLRVRGHGSMTHPM
jgi:Cu/Ag efflux protein CusF